MRFAAITLNPYGARAVREYSSADVDEDMRATLSPLIRLKDDVLFDLPPQWSIAWEPRPNLSLATFHWKGTPVAISVMAWSGWKDTFDTMLLDLAPSVDELRDLQLPAVAIIMMPTIQLPWEELRECFEMLPDVS